MDLKKIKLLPIIIFILLIIGIIFLFMFRSKQLSFIQTTFDKKIGEVDYEVKYSHPKGWNSENLSFDDGKENEIKAFAVILNSESVVDIMQEFEEGKQVKMTLGEIGNKKILFENRDFNMDGVENLSREIYWDTKVNNKVVRFTCYGPKENIETLNKVCDNFIRSFELKQK